MGEHKKKKTLVVVLGATATGKTAISIELARRLKAVVLSCDSRQFYKEIPIGTAAPTAEEQGDVTHHFVGCRSVVDDYSCGGFEKDAIELLERLFEVHDTVVMTGGSGLYIDAVCKGMDNIPSSTEVRAELAQRLEVEGFDALVSQLRELDVVYAESADLANKQRVLRALEVCLASGHPYSSFRRAEGVARNFEVVKIGIEMDRALLYDRINRRVDIMLEQGLEAEARNVYPLRACNSLQTVGYRELFDYFDGVISLEAAIELIKRNSRRYAKRQITWFGRDEKTLWFDGLGAKVVDEIEKSLDKFVK